MSEAAQRVKADGALVGQPCLWCRVALASGDDAAVCGACGTAHHARCWDKELGCGKADCINAPLKRLDKDQPSSSGPVVSGPIVGAPQPSQPPPGFMFCPACRNPILAGSQVCDLCGAITSPDGIYHGPTQTAPGAVAALVCGIIGLFICGPVFGPIAIANSSKAKSAIRADPRYSGEGMATAGMVLGILDLIGWAIVLILRFSSM